MSEESETMATMRAVNPRIVTTGPVVRATNGPQVDWDRLGGYATRAIPYTVVTCSGESNGGLTDG